MHRLYVDKRRAVVEVDVSDVMSLDVMVTRAQARRLIGCYVWRAAIQRSGPK